MNWRRAQGAVWVLLACWAGTGIAQAEEGLVLNLQEGLRLAMSHNENLLMARDDVARSQERIREVRAAGLPRVNAALNYQRNWLLSSFFFGGRSVKIGTENNLTGTLSVRQALYSGGRVSASVDAARHSAGVAAEIERQVRQQIMAQVEAGLYDVLLARELVRVSQLALERAHSNLTQVEARRRAGRSSEYDLLRAQVQISSLRADSVSAENGLRVAQMNLKNVIGMDLDRPVVVQAEFREATRLGLDDLESLQSMGLERRPELRQLQGQMHLLERTVQVEKAGWRPTLDLVASGQTQFQSNEFDVIDQEWRKSWNTALVLEMPLFDGMRTGARVAQARTQVRRAGREREQLERQIRAEIQQAFLDVQEATQRREAEAEATGQAEKGLLVAESRFGSGVGTQLEILDAQLALVQARTDHVTARRDRSLALLRLELATGVLGEEGE